MNSDIEKLLSAVQGGRLSEDEMRDIGDMLLKSLSPEQERLLKQVTDTPGGIDEFLNSPEVRKLFQ